jgi:hypothetical protein
MSSIVLLELRMAFKTCARPRSSPIFRPAFFSTHRSLQKRRGTTPPAQSNAKSSPNLGIAKRPESNPTEGKDEGATVLSEQSDRRSKAVEPGTREYTDVETGKRVPVPMKVMPKAQLTPELVLNPKERMQLEYITRRVPKREPGKVFRERLLIYHRGLSRTNAIVGLKVFTMIGIATTLAIVAPAYYSFGAPWSTIATILFVGCNPFLAVAWRTKPLVTWIYLILPTYARQSPKAALEYARNLPDSAQLQICYMRSIPLPADVTVQVRDLKPVTSRFRPVTFEWVGNRVDSGPWYRPNLTQFFVKPKSGTGKEKRDTIPGIWEAVYKRLLGVESRVSAKWKG